MKWKTDMLFNEIIGKWTQDDCLELEPEWGQHAKLTFEIGKQKTDSYFNKLMYSFKKWWNRFFGFIYLFKIETWYIRMDDLGKWNAKEIITTGRGASFDTVSWSFHKKND